MSWGIKITIAYSVFVLFMLFMVYKSFQQRIDLVTPDYYADELKYQGVIDGNQNHSLLSAPVSIVQDDDRINVEFPGELAGIESGTITFYRPDNPAHDIKENLPGKHIYQMDKSKLQYGLYKVKLEWNTAGKRYNNEQSLFVTK